MWKYNGSSRQDFANILIEGQESVWDYPRPPLVQSVNVDMEVHYHDAILAKCDGLIRVLEAASPPIYNISFDQVDLSFFRLVMDGPIANGKVWLLIRG